MLFSVKTLKRGKIIFLSALLAAPLLFTPSSAAPARAPEGPVHPAAFLSQRDRLPGPQEVAAYRARLRLEVKTWLEQKYLGTPKPGGSTENYGRKDLEDMLCIYDLGVDYAFQNEGSLQGFNVFGYENVTSNLNLLTDILRLCANTYKYLLSFIGGVSPEEAPSRPRPPAELKSPSSVRDC